MATRWDPFRDLLTIHDELNRLFGRTFGVAGGAAPGAWAPPLDAYETAERFVIVVELPGVEPDDVEVRVEDSTLTVRGERRFYEGLEEEAFHRVERRFGPFARSVTLPATADTDRVEATFDKGVLTVEVPKAVEVRPKRITVKAKR